MISLAPGILTELLPARRYANEGTVAMTRCLSVCASLPVTSRFSIDTCGLTELIFGTEASFDLSYPALSNGLVCWCTLNIPYCIIFCSIFVIFVDVLKMDIWLKVATHYTVCLCVETFAHCNDKHMCDIKDCSHCRTKLN